MLSKLIGKRFNCISRAADLLCLFLGEDFIYHSPIGRSVAVSEYSLHCQTQWRFRQNGKILLASGDIFEPYDNNIPEDWKYDLHGRPDELSSVFDVRAKTFAGVMCGAIVSECSLSETKDVFIRFSNGVVFEQFMPASNSDEEWRLIDYLTNRHIVCCITNGLTELGLE